MSEPLERPEGGVEAPRLTVQLLVRGAAGAVFAALLVPSTPIANDRLTILALVACAAAAAATAIVQRAARSYAGLWSRWRVACAASAASMVLLAAGAAQAAALILTGTLDLQAQVTALARLFDNQPGVALLAGPCGATIVFAGGVIGFSTLDQAARNRWLVAFAGAGCLPPLLASVVAVQNAPLDAEGRAWAVLYMTGVMLALATVLLGLVIAAELILGAVARQLLRLVRSEAARA